MTIWCSSGHLGAIVASLIPAMNVINLLLLGLGIWKDDATVKSMTRNGDIRYVLNGVEIELKCLHMTKAQTSQNFCCLSSSTFHALSFLLVSPKNEGKNVACPYL